MNLIQIQLDSIRRALGFIDYSKPKRIDYSKPKRIMNYLSADGSFVTDRGYAPGSGTYVPPSMVTIVRAEEFDYFDWERPQQERPQQERDPTDWLNPYAQEERDSYEDIRRESLEEFLQYASTNDAYW